MNENREKKILSQILALAFSMAMALNVSPAFSAGEKEVEAKGDKSAAKTESAAEAEPVISVTAGASGEKMSIDTPAATVSKLKLTPRETPAAVTIVDRETFEMRGAENTQEILESVPGVTTSSRYGASGSIYYRGVGMGSVTQLFNGIATQYDVCAARPVDSWIYDRVEAIGGPSSFLYGAGAVGGTINYITKLATSEGDFNEARVSYGSHETSNLALGVNHGLGDGVGAENYLRVDASQANSAGYVEGHKRDALASAASLLTVFTPALSHTLAVEYQKEHVDRPYWGTPLLTPLKGNGKIDPDTRFENYNSSDGVYEQTVKWGRSLLEYAYSDSVKIKNTIYHYDAIRDYRNVELYKFNEANDKITRSATYLQRHDQEINGDRIELTKKSELAGKLSDWAMSLDYIVNEQTRFPLSIRDTVSTVNPTDFTTESFWDIPGVKPGFNPDRTSRINTMAISLENRTKLSDVLSLVTALRRDQIDLKVTNHRKVTETDPAVFNRTFTPINGRAGLVYDLSPAANVYIQYSTAGDPPAGHMATSSFSQIRDFDLTTGTQYEAGSKFEFMQGRGVATVSIFAITRKNIAVTDPNNPGVTIPVGQQSGKGVELAASLKVTDALLAQGNFSYTDAKYDDFTEKSGDSVVSRAGKTPANTPAQVANLWLTYGLMDKVKVGADARYVSSRFGDTANTVSDDAYTLFGAFASYQLKANSKLTARVSNLTDEVYANSVEGVNMFYLGAPRAFDLSWQISF